MRVKIKRILRKYGYPPNKQAKATDLVLQQAEVLCKDWAEKGVEIETLLRANSEYAR